MNTLANSLFRVSLRYASIPNAPVAAYLSQAATENVSVRKRKSINKAMQAYIERVKEFEHRTITESADYESGKRFLANIMGEDPATFNNDEVDKAVEYLLPSGIYQKWCRPEMKPPQDVIQSAKFDDTGRPYHFLFYTLAASVFDLQHEAVKRIDRADKLLEQLHRKGHMPEKEHQIDLLSSEWVDRLAMGRIINESIAPHHYEKTLDTLERLATHPMSKSFEDFIMTYRKPIVIQLTEMEFPKVEQDAEGRFVVQSSQRRKTSTATVVVQTPGTGKIIINNQDDLCYFTDMQARQQVVYPLQFTGLLSKVDLDITVKGGGVSSKAGAIRHALSVALAPLVDEQKRAEMQIAGLLTYDRRDRERKRFGRKGARRGYTWLKR